METAPVVGSTIEPSCDAPLPAAAIEQDQSRALVMANTPTDLRIEQEEVETSTATLEWSPGARRHDPLVPPRSWHVGTLFEPPPRT